MHSSNPGLAGHKWSKEDYYFFCTEVLHIRQTASYRAGEAKKKKKCVRVLIPSSFIYINPFLKEISLTRMLLDYKSFFFIF